MPRTNQAAPTNGVWAVSLAFQILETLAGAERPWRVTDLAETLGTSKTRIFRYLQTLKELGYVSQESDTDRYRVGIKLAFLGNAAAMSFDLVSMSKPILHRLRDIVGMAVILSKVENDEICIVYKVDGVSSLSINATIGLSLSLNCTAQGKLALAYSKNGLLERTIAAGLRAQTPHSITDPARLRVEIERVRSNGWATAPSEMLTGLNTLAVPVLDHDSRLSATIGLLGSVDDIPAEPDAEKLQALQATAREIGHRIFAAGSGNPG